MRNRLERCGVSATSRPANVISQCSTIPISRSSANLTSSSAKRYERMMKAHGIYQGNQPIRETTVASSRPSKKNESSSGVKNKKRKLDQFNDSNNNTDTADDDEDIPSMKPEFVKTEPTKSGSTEAESLGPIHIKEESMKTVNDAVVKQEPLSVDGASDCYAGGAADEGYQAGDTIFFDDFLHPSAFDQPGLSGQPIYKTSFRSDGYGAEVLRTGTMVKGEAMDDSIIIAD